jgi:hypothetical protein
MDSLILDETLNSRAMETSGGARSDKVVALYTTSAFGTTISPVTDGKAADVVRPKRWKRQLISKCQ